MLRLAGTPHICFTQHGSKGLTIEVDHAQTPDLKQKAACQQRTVAAVRVVDCVKNVSSLMLTWKNVPSFVKTCQSEQNRRWTS
jgi:hypothetical protein